MCVVLFFSGQINLVISFFFLGPYLGMFFIKRKNLVISEQKEIYWTNVKNRNIELLISKLKIVVPSEISCYGRVSA